MLDNRNYIIIHLATFIYARLLIFFKPSDVHNILHLNVSGLKVNNLINFITPFQLCTTAIFI